MNYLKMYWLRMLLEIAIVIWVACKAPVLVTVFITGSYSVSYPGL